MIFFGIDPGTAVTGYGVIKSVNNSVTWLDSGVINTRPDSPLAERLELIYSSLKKKMGEFSPDRVSIEEAFYGKNVHTTLVLGHARGVAMLAAAKSGAKVSEYSPREVKKAVSGNGNASKDQVKYMVKMILSVPETNMKTDAFDALGMALCDFYHTGPAVRINR
ncbi:MAG TPA: crossover junction endodeoxyribonuclease RuvC [Chitinispirillaceae bacterium]|jgi:crossover junction endodeoxyribonuclease RuvC|nr:crossover junction endodeoxyribonuclease RuvC [Chitinispirillaceae bacterium]